MSNTKKSLLDKVWSSHHVAQLKSGNDQIFVGLHLIHEVTSPQAFQLLRENGLTVLFPERTFATEDHIIPTTQQERSHIKDKMAQEMLDQLAKNTKNFGIRLFKSNSGRQGIVHVISPELGLTQPGTVIVCGDSHTSTHGAFGTLAFGIGTTQVRDVLATQTLSMNKPKLRQIRIEGVLSKGISAKDVILYIIRLLGVNGGLGFCYEYSGSVVESMTMEERMTLCNMTIEGGARMGYVNPDAITFEYLKGRPFAPSDEGITETWSSYISDVGCHYDDIVVVQASSIRPIVTWGVKLNHSVDVDGTLPIISDSPANVRDSLEDSYRYMCFDEGVKIKGTKIDVAFIGSCTNGRISDFRMAAEILKGHKISPNVRALAVPGSEAVEKMCFDEEIDKIFTASGFQWRKPGCSMCLAMNPDKLRGNEVCASSSNRNFKGRQGSPTGRTLLMSPQMVALAAIHGSIQDVTKFL